METVVPFRRAKCVGVGCGPAAPHDVAPGRHGRRGRFRGRCDVPLRARRARGSSGEPLASAVAGRVDAMRFRHASRAYRPRVASATGAAGRTVSEGLREDVGGRGGALTSGEASRCGTFALKMHAAAHRNRPIELGSTRPQPPSSSSSWMSRCPRVTCSLRSRPRTERQCRQAARRYRRASASWRCRDLTQPAKSADGHE